MEPVIIPDKLLPHALAPIAIPAPRASDGAGSALRRAFAAPGTLPEDIAHLLRALDAIPRRRAG